MMHCAKFGWNWPSGSGEDFFNFVNVFSLFPNNVPLEKGWSFIWTNLDPLHQRILCAKFGWNWPSGSGEEDEKLKSLQTDRQTDRQPDGRTDGRTDRRRMTGAWAFSSGELKIVIWIKLNRKWTIISDSWKYIFAFINYHKQNIMYIVVGFFFSVPVFALENYLLVMIEVQIYILVKVLRGFNLTRPNFFL